MSERDLNIRDEGPRDALPVVLLHAFPLHGEQWEAQCAALAGRARTIRFDVRGFGESPLGTSAYFLEHLTDDLFAVLDRLSVRAALLCGLSMGGYMALRAVERDPARVCGLLLADTQALSDSDQAKLGRAETLRKLWADGRASFADATLKRSLSPRTFERNPELVTRIRSMIMAARDESIAAALAALATRTDTTASLTRIAVPTAVVVGEHDAITPPAVARTLAAQIRGAEVHELDDAGHLSNMEAPAAFNQILLQHLNRVATAS